MERIGLSLAEQYCALARTDAEREFAQAQRREEGRHVAVCKRLTAEHGALEPPSFHLRQMESVLVGASSLHAKLLGLLGGDIMGDFLIRRLLETGVSADARELLQGVLADEMRHIEFLRARLGEELRSLGPGDRLACLWAQVRLLLADVLETGRLGAHFEAIGLAPRVESMLCYLYYRKQIAELSETGTILLLPSGLVRLFGRDAFSAAERALPGLSTGRLPS